MRSGVATGQRASTCIRTVSGHWLHVAGTALEIGQADVAVTLQRAAVTDILPTVAACNLLTARESDVVNRLALGMPSKHIARELGLSLLTINTYLSSIYRKCGVSGREELFGQLT